MNAPEAVETSAQAAPSVYEAYAQLVKMLLPSSGCLAIYSVDGEMTWCSDGFERPDFRELVDDFRARKPGPEINQGVVRETSGGVAALIGRLGGTDESGSKESAFGYLLIELGQSSSNAARSMAASMSRPVLRCLAAQLALEQAPAVEAPSAEPPAGLARLDFLLGLGQINLNAPAAIEQLLKSCVDNLDCLSAVFCIPDQNLTVVAEKATDDAMRSHLDSTRRHLLAWVQLNNRPMVVNRVDSVKAPYKILSCPVVDREDRPRGLIALFRGAESANFELDDVRLIEFLARQAIALLTERQDPATGLMSRAAFERSIDEELCRKSGAPAGTLLYIDIDQLHSINESLGYTAGDEAILRTAQLIRRSLTPGETACRLSADRFVAWLPERDRDSADTLGNELASAAESLGYASGEERIPLSLCFGVAEAPADLSQSRHWIARAELACQQNRQADEAAYNGDSQSGN